MTAGNPRGALTAAIAGAVAAFRAGTPPGARRAVAVRLLAEPGISAAADADRVQPAGSLLKLITAVALYDAAGRGEADPDAAVPVAALARTAYPSVLAAFDPGRSLSLRELCALSLITSDNPAAEHLRALLGQDRLDTVIRGLGLTRTTFAAGFTDPELGSRGRANLTTAADMLRLITHIETTPGLADLRRFLLNNQRNQRIPLRLDDDIPVLHKTGSLTGVVNDVAVVHHPAGRIALAFLCDGEPDAAATATAIGDTAQRITDALAAARAGGGATAE